MIIQELTLRQFRCFQDKTITFDGRVIVIEGQNGSGKSSLLEALHYCCYLRSFRTHLNRELVNLEQDYFFVSVKYLSSQSDLPDQISVGFSGTEGKIVKSNQKVVSSYKDLMSSFRIVTLTADDIKLIQGSPELRRDFLNYALLLNEPTITVSFKRYKKTLEHRNAILMLPNQFAIAPTDEFLVWTKKLWEASRELQKERIQYLLNLEDTVNTLLQTYFVGDDAADLHVKFVYQAKNMSLDTFEDFWNKYQKNTLAYECSMRRSMFGAHLDDFSIVFQNKKARMYASRGQQKLLILLIKIAQLQKLSSHGEPGVFLLDDFMTDFDDSRIERCLAALKDLKYQMFLSCPVMPKSLAQAIAQEDMCLIQL